MGRNILKSTIQNASFNIVFQIIFRCITFCINAYIIRHIGHNVLGIMNVRLLLLESTLEFLSKEPFIKACLSDTRSHDWVKVINQMWLTLPLCGLLCVPLTYIWIFVLPSVDETYNLQYVNGCIAISVSCLILRLAESVILVAQSYCFVKLKVVMDTVHIVVRTIVFLSIIVQSPQNAINAFSLAQLVSCFVFAVGYYLFFWWYIKELKKYRVKKKPDDDSIFSHMDDFKFTSLKDFLPTFNTKQGILLDNKLSVLTISFAKQCVVKQILTEGEKYVMTVSPVLSFEEQSKYDIVNNLGSLAARFIFRPVEESGYFYFTQMIKRDIPIGKQNKDAIVESLNVFNKLLKIVTTVGILVVVFGQGYSSTLLYIYGGNALYTDPLPVILLRSQCVAVLLLALNGVTECYVFATMTATQLDRYNYVMVIFSASFLLLSYVLTFMFGSVGFIMANSLNMLSRICHSIYYILNQFKKSSFQPFKGVLPGPVFTTAVVVSLVLTKLSEEHLLKNSMVLHVAVGAVCFLTSLLIWVFENNELMKMGIERLKQKIT